MVRQRCNRLARVINADEDPQARGAAAVTGDRMSSQPAGIFARIHHLSRQAVWAAADQGINPVLQLVMTPYFLARLGKQGFALWMLGITVVNMSQLVSCGAGITATKHVSSDLGENAPHQAVTAVRAALALAVLGGLTAVSLLGMLAPTVASVLFSAMGPPQDVARVLMMASVAAAIQEIDGVYAGAIKGAERFDLGAKIELPARIGIAATLALLANRIGTADALLAGLIPALAMKAGFKGWRASVLLADSRACLPSFAVSPLKRVLRFGLWQWLQAAGTALFTSLDQLLVGGLLGARALLRYSVCLQLAQYVHLVPSVLMQVVFPRVSSLGRSLGSHDRNSLLRSTTLLALALALLLGLPLIIFARPLLAAWIGAEFAAENQRLLALLVLVHILLAVNIGAYFILLGLGESARSARIVLSAAALQSIAAILLAPLGILAFACNRLVYSIGTAFLYRAARARGHGH